MVASILRPDQSWKLAYISGFTSALRETFKTIGFPTRQALREIDDFRMEFDRNDYKARLHHFITQPRLIPSKH